MHEDNQFHQQTLTVSQPNERSLNTLYPMTFRKRLNLGQKQKKNYGVFERADVTDIRKYTDEY